MLYKSSIRPVGIYAVPVWGYSFKSYWKYLQTVQSKVVRMSMNSAWYIRNYKLHRALDNPELRVFCAKLITKFIDLASAHPNSIISQVSEYSLERFYGPS